jgi:bacteriocin biosynthesis cyclodehydratase domain-containing protein
MAEPARLRLKRHYSVVAHSADVVEIRHGAWNAVSFTVADDSGSGRLLRIVNRLDGQLSTAEIAEAESVPESEVELLVDHLAELGLLEEGPQHALDYYLEHVVPNFVLYGRQPQQASGVVLLGDEVVTTEIARVLASSPAAAGLAVEQADPELRRRLAAGASAWTSDGLAFEEEAEAFEAWRDRLVVFGSAALNPLQLQAFNRLSLRHRIPWIHASVDGPFLLVGPTFLPLRSACYECLEARVGMNLREGASYQKYKLALAEGRASGATAPIEGVLAAMLASHVAYEVLNVALTGTSFTVGKLLAVYLPTMEFTFNEVLRLPGCGACAPAPESDDRELYFELRTLLDGDASNDAGPRR